MFGMIEVLPRYLREEIMELFHQFANTTGFPPACQLFSMEGDILVYSSPFFYENDIDGAVTPYIHSAILSLALELFWSMMEGTAEEMVITMRQYQVHIFPLGFEFGLAICLNDADTRQQPPIQPTMLQLARNIAYLMDIDIYL